MQHLHKQRDIRLFVMFVTTLVVGGKVSLLQFRNDGLNLRRHIASGIETGLIMILT